MDHHRYDHLFRDRCLELGLPFDRVKAFAMAVSQLNLEFNEPDEVTRRVGVMAVPESEAIDFGVLPGDLINPAKNIEAGCQRVAAILREMTHVLPEWRRYEWVFLSYMEGWARQFSFVDEYYFNLEQIRREFSCRDTAN